MLQNTKLIYRNQSLSYIQAKNNWIDIKSTIHLNYYPPKKEIVGYKF